MVNVGMFDQLLASFPERWGRDYLGYVQDRHYYGGSYDMGDECVYALVYDRSCDFGVRCVEFTEHWDGAGSWQETTFCRPFHFAWGHVTPHDARDCEFLRAACAAYASTLEVQALVQREEQLDEQTVCKNETFYRGKAIPGYPVLV